MNGRIYDPTLDRFLQAEPHNQKPKNSHNCMDKTCSCDFHEQTKGSFKNGDLMYRK